MNLYLKEGESVLRSWDYAKKRGKSKGTLNLTVTNNRIISTSFHRNKIERKEFEVSSVKSVDTFIGTKRAGFWKVLLAIVLFLYSIPVLLTGLAMVYGIEQIPDASYKLGIVYIVLGLLFILFAALLLRNKNLFALRILLRSSATPRLIKKQGRRASLKFYLLPLIITIGSAFAIIKLKSCTLYSIVLLDFLFVFAIALWIITIRKHPLSAKKLAIKNPRPNSYVNIKFNKLISKEILEELGAIIIDARDKSYPQQLAAANS